MDPGVSCILEGGAVKQVLKKDCKTLGFKQSLKRIYPCPALNSSASNMIFPGVYQINKVNNVVSSTQMKMPGNVSNQQNINQSSYYILGASDNTNNFTVYNSPGTFANNNLHFAQLQVQNNIFDKNKTPQTQNMSTCINISALGQTSTQTTFKKSGLHPDIQMKGIQKVPEPTQVNIKADVREKIGYLKIEVSESFLPWNMASSSVLDLDFMRHLVDITNIEVVFPNKNYYGNGVCDSLKQLVYNRLLTDWLVLKCEEKQIPLFKTNSQVEVYAVNNFTTLLTDVAQETCLPLPFITEDNENHLKYFYLNFSKTNNDKVKKLNVLIFHDADNGRKKVACKYPGIRLDCLFECAIKGFTFHVHQSAISTYEVSVDNIRRHIIYNHIVWGFLQSWVRKVRGQYNGCFQLEDIAKNISLCQAKSEANVAESGIYRIDYLNFYLKFDPVTLKETKTSFSIDNFETNSVSNISLVQYYRQFFLINDMHYSDALQNIILFSRNSGYSSVRTMNQFLYQPARSNLVIPFEWSRFPPGGIDHRVSSNQQNLANVQTVENSANHQPVRSMPQSQTSNPPKPLLKTRTVEEINSSVDAKKRNGMLRVDFDSIGVSKPRSERMKNFQSSIRKILNSCYDKNLLEIRTEDESSDAKVIEKRFDEAVEGAMCATSLEPFIETIYTHLQFFFTNTTCQNILNKMIWRALQKKYPDLNGVHLDVIEKRTVVAKSCKSCEVSESGKKRTPTTESGTQGGSEHLSQATKGQKNQQTDSSRGLDTVQLQNPRHVLTHLANSASFAAIKVSHPQNRFTLTVSHPHGSNASTSKSYPPPNTISHTKPKGNSVNTPDALVPREEFASGIQKSPRKITANPSLCDSSTSSNVCRRQENEFEPVTSPSPRLKTPKKGKHGSPQKSGTCESEQEKCVNKIEESGSRCTLNEPGTSGITSNTETRLNVVSDLSEESGEADVICIDSQRSSSSSNVDHVHEESSNEERVKSMETDGKASRSADGKESDRLGNGIDLRRFNLKPCSVVLDAGEVDRYLKKSRKRKREEAESDENFFTREQRRSKKKEVSDLELMEARARVLQKLRKRRAVYARHQKMTSEELDQFMVRRNSTAASSDGEYEESKDTEEEVESEDDGGKDEKESRPELKLKELRVVITRLEETPEYEKYRDRLNLGEGSSNFRNDFENFPKNKRKYFEIREGKLYLKEQYHVKNGVIVRVEKEDKGPDIVRPKIEPESSRNDSEYCDSFIKQEQGGD